MNALALLAALLVAVAVAAPASQRNRVRSRLRGAERPRRRLWQRTATARTSPRGSLAGNSQPGGSQPGGNMLRDSPSGEAIAAAAVVFLVVVVLVGALAGLAVAALAAGSVSARRRARRHRQRRRIERGLPEVIDLLGLVVASGQTTSAALAGIGPRTPEPFRSELRDVLRRSSAGEPFAESLRRLQARLGPPVTMLVHSLVAAEIDGVALGPALDRASDEAHRRRGVRASEAARRVPVLMLFPLVFCILPAFGLLTVLPLLVGSIASLTG